MTGRLGFALTSNISTQSSNVYCSCFQPLYDVFQELAGQLCSLSEEIYQVVPMWGINKLTCDKNSISPTTLVDNCVNHLPTAALWRVTTRIQVAPLKVPVTQTNSHPRHQGLVSSGTVDHQHCICSSCIVKYIILAANWWECPNLQIMVGISHLIVCSHTVHATYPEAQVASEISPCLAYLDSLLWRR